MPEPGEPKTTFTAEDVRIQQYGDVAIVAFRLMGATERKGTTEVSTFLNSGTFLKRNGEWRAVSWQATRAPRPDGEARESAAAAQALFHQALLAGDVEALKSVVDEGFTWTRLDGTQVTRAQLIEELGAGRLRYSKLQTSDVTVAAYGDTAVVRGITAGERSGAAGSGDAGPFTAFYTLTLVGQGGGWKAVALHTSRP